MALRKTIRKRARSVLAPEKRVARLEARLNEPRAVEINKMFCFMVTDGEPCLEEIVLEKCPLHGGGRPKFTYRELIARLYHRLALVEAKVRV